jgi:putative nucleotidyltransferase with HDIG domain
MGHAVRSCMLGMRIARQIGLPVAEQADLFYALLLKDAGCSSNSSRLFHILTADEIRAKRNVKLTDWTRTGWDSLQYAIGHVATGKPFLERIRTLLQVAAKQQVESCELVKIRCERGASIARRIGFSEAVAQGIHSLDEHWNGGGYPDGLRGNAIPQFSRLMNLSQTLDVFLTCKGEQAALDVAESRASRWFDPELVRAVRSLAKQGELWKGLDGDVSSAAAMALEPEQRHLMADDAAIDGICAAFAEIIDAKSPFTFRHSNGVADATLAICNQFGFDEARLRFMRRSALLHDIGKLSVSNAVLEKPGKLDAEEWKAIQQHPYYTFELLRRIPGFEALAEIAASHHEKLDGSGYYRGYKAEQLSIEARILTVADIYDALAAKRPYRDAMPIEQVFAILDKDAGRALDPTCVEALKTASGLASLSKAIL